MVEPGFKHHMCIFKKTKTSYSVAAHYMERERQENWKTVVIIWANNDDDQTDSGSRGGKKDSLEK